MKQRAAFFLACIFKGYGQLFLTPNIASGMLYLAALACISPLGALWSLAGAVTITAAGWRLLRDKPFLLSSGLFGVNGVLLGALWIEYPEVSAAIKGMLTVAGSLAIALALAPVARHFHARKAPWTLFSLPYVAAAWCGIWILSATGQSDPHLHAGWRKLAAGDIRAAHAHFMAAQPASARAIAYQRDGLGWCAFMSNDEVRAVSLFVSAAEMAPDFADPRDGIGWALFRERPFFQIGALDARGAFEEAVTLDPLLADSWDGLGWIALKAGRTAEARAHFSRAAMAAPLFEDPHLGLALCREAEGGASATYRGIHAWLATHVPSHLRFLPVTTLAGWLLFLIGIAVHSRLSLAMALGAVTLGILLAPFFPAGALDAMFFFNAMAIAIALGGQYLRWSGISLFWTMACIIAMAFIWSFSSSASAASGFPLLCLPFNIIMLGSLWLFRRLRCIGFDDHVVPLEMAVTSPRRVRLWSLKRSIARRCWLMLGTPSSAGESGEMRKGSAP